MMLFNPVLTPKQAATIRLSEGSRIAVWEGSVRSSKTIVSILAWARYIATAPQGLLLMVGASTTTLRSNVVDPMVDMFGSAIQPVYGSNAATMFGRRVELVGADNAGATRRIKGKTLAGAYCDELTELGGTTGLEWWQMLLSRMSVPGARILATTNPGSPSHWLLKDYLERACLVVSQDGRVIREPDGNQAMNLHRYRFTLDDNPNLEAAYIEATKANYSGLFYDRYILGNWVAGEGAVFPMFDSSKHVLTESGWARVGQRWCVAIDHGSTNPTHAVRLGVDELLERVVVDGELRLADNTLTVGEQARRVIEWVRGMGINPHETVFVVDPAARGFRVELNSQLGRYPREARNAVLPGIQAVGTLLGGDTPSLVFHNTPELVRELTGYKWDSKKSDQGEDVPVKEDDHGVDALRYGVMFLEPFWKRFRAYTPPAPAPLDPIFT